MLNGLCEKTEPASPSNTQLFSEHAISVQEMLKEVRDLHTGRQAINPDSERDLMINIMRQANKIWKFRKKWEEIKKTGSYEAKINLHAEIQAKIHIEVVKEEEKT